MKKVTIYDDVHLDVKLESVRRGRTFPSMASELLRQALVLLRKGDISIPDHEESAGTSEKAAIPEATACAVGTRP